VKAEPPRAVRIVSQCSSWEEFVAVFQPYLDGGSLFIATATPEGEGSDIVFTMTLAGGRTILRGDARVVESHRDRSNFYGLRGMKLRFGELDDASRRTLASLAESKKSPRKRPDPDVIDCLIFDDDLPAGGAGATMPSATTPMAALAMATTLNPDEAFDAAVTIPPEGFERRFAAGPALTESGDDATEIHRERPGPATDGVPETSAAETVTERLPALEELSTAGGATPVGTAAVADLATTSPDSIELGRTASVAALEPPAAATTPMTPLATPRPAIGLGTNTPLRPSQVPLVRSRVPRPSDEPLPTDVDAEVGAAEPPPIPTVVTPMPVRSRGEDDASAEPAAMATRVGPSPLATEASEARLKAYKRAGLHPTPIPPGTPPVAVAAAQVAAAQVAVATAQVAVATAQVAAPSRMPTATPAPTNRGARAEHTMIVQRPIAPSARITITVTSIVAALLGLGVGYLLWGLER
jgi:hypothetical protein